MSIVAAVASLLRGSKFVHAEAGSTIPQDRAPVREVAIGEAGEELS
jgi:hypothetical protein